MESCSKSHSGCSAPENQKKNNTLKRKQKLNTNKSIHQFNITDINGNEYPLKNTSGNVILLVNIVLSGQTDSTSDINFDGMVNILDIVQIVNIILN